MTLIQTAYEGSLRGITCPLHSIACLLQTTDNRWHDFVFGPLPEVPSQYAAQPCTDCLPCSLDATLLDATCFALGHSLIAQTTTAEGCE